MEPDNGNKHGNLKRVKQIDIRPGMSFTELVDGLAETGFGAKRLASACRIYEKMVKDEKCVKFFALAGAMVPVGMQKIIHDMIKDGFIDVLVTTGANLTHDVAECLGYPHLQGNTAEGGEPTDADLHKAELNRIYDVFMANRVYEAMEDFITSLEPENGMSVRRFLKYLGEKLPDHPHSILKICAEKDIPIYCPAFTDSGLAMQLAFAFPQLNLDHFDDLRTMINTAWDAKTAGVCIIGGGVPKNYIFQAMQFSPHSAKYAIQITMDRPEPGGLSGAELREAISWGKISENAEYTTVIADATTVLPILYGYLTETCR